MKEKALDKSKNIFRAGIGIALCSFIVQVVLLKKREAFVVHAWGISE